MPYQADFTIWLNPNSKHKTQGWFLSSPSIFTKPNFEGVISSIPRNFSFSLRFRFDYRLDKKRPGGEVPTKTLTQHQGGPPSGKCVKKCSHKKLAPIPPKTI